MGTQHNNQLTLDQAYQATYLWLDHVGDPPLDISEPAHGSVELLTEKAFIRVRSSEGPVEQSSVLALLRAADPGKKLLLFSPSGFSPGALSIAETQGIGLFTLDSHGRAVPETTHARAVAPETEPDPPFAPEPVDEEDSFWSYTPPPRIEEEDAEEEDAEGIDGWRHRLVRLPPHVGQRTTETPTSARNAAQGCRLIPTKVSHMRCRTCGGHNIETVE